MIKILFIGSQVQGNGGIPRFNRNLIFALRNNPQAQLKVIALNEDNSAMDLLGASQSKIQFLILYLKTLLTYRPQLIIIGLLNFAPLAVLKYLSGGKSAIILHGVEAWYKRRKIKLFFRFIDEFWSVSNYTKSCFTRHNHVPENKVKKIFNTIPDSWLNHTMKISDQSFMLSVTRLVKQEGYKGIDKTIESLVPIQKLMREKGFHYIIVASGNDLERHKQLAVNSGVSDLIRFQSRITDDQLMDLYRDCSFFILPSTGEGFGIVFLEAMAFAKPCIGAKDCGTEDVIENEVTGFLIKPETSQIGEKVEFLIRNMDKRNLMGAAGARKLKNDFAFRKFEQTLEELL